MEDHLAGDVLIDHGVIVPLGAVLGQHPSALSVGVEQAIPPLLAPHLGVWDHGPGVQISQGTNLYFQTMGDILIGNSC